MGLQVTSAEVTAALLAYDAALGPHATQFPLPVRLEAMRAALEAAAQQRGKTSCLDAKPGSIATK